MQLLGLLQLINKTAYVWRRSISRSYFSQCLWRVMQILGYSAAAVIPLGL